MNKKIKKGIATLGIIASITGSLAPLSSAAVKDNYKIVENADSSVRMCQWSSKALNEAKVYGNNNVYYSIMTEGKGCIDNYSGKGGLDNIALAISAEGDVKGQEFIEQMDFRPNSVARKLHKVTADKLFGDIKKNSMPKKSVMDNYTLKERIKIDLGTGDVLYIEVNSLKKGKTPRRGLPKEICVGVYKNKKYTYVKHGFITDEPWWDKSDENGFVLQKWDGKTFE